MKINWLHQINIQTRLFLIFTFVLLLAIGALAYLLNLSGQVIQANTRGREIYLTARQNYQAQALLQRMLLDHSTYILSGYLEDQRDFDAASHQLQDYLEQAAMNMSANAPDVQTLQHSREKYTSMFFQIVEAYEMDDFAQVEALDDQIHSEVLPAAFEAADNIQGQSMSELDVLVSEVDNFQVGAGLAIILSILVFTFAAIGAGWYIRRQVNRPIEKLIRAAAAIENNRYDPATLDDLTSRKDEIGLLAREFVQMGHSLENRSLVLQQEALSIQNKIR